MECSKYLLLAHCLTFLFVSCAQADNSLRNDIVVENQTAEKRLVNKQHQAKQKYQITVQLVWQDQNISGFPDNLFVTPMVARKATFVKGDDGNAVSSTQLSMKDAQPPLSKLSGSIMVKVNESGVASFQIPAGSYSVTTELNYHWMGETLVRLNDSKSNYTFNTNNQDTHSIVLPLHTLPFPVSTNQKGILLSEHRIEPAVINSFMASRMDFFEIPGATLSIFKDNEIIYDKQFGVKRNDSQQKVNSETLFEAGSITKLVFAYAVMRLYDRGVIDLDEPLVNYLPHSEINDDRYKKITARLVLSHQSGMSNWPKKDASGFFQLNFEPGAQYGYSGKAFEYLKEVLETITSSSIEEILTQEVLNPLNINDMYFKGSDIISARGANGHKRNQPSEIFIAKRTMVAYSLQTTSRALAKFAMALHKRKGLKPETYDEFLRIHSTRKDEVNWGLGMRIEQTTQGRTYGHSGITGRGFIGNLVLYDESGLGFVILTNSQMGGWLSLPLLNEFLVLGKENGFKNR